MKRRKDSKNRVLKDGEYQRSSGTYEYKWTDRRGNRHTISAKTLEELRKKEEDVNRDILNGVNVDKRNLTINDLYERWKQLKQGLKDNTFRNYIYMYEQFVYPNFGKTRIANLVRTDVRAFYNTLYVEQNLKPNTIDVIHNVLHQVLDLAVDDNFLMYNPAEKALTELKKAHNKDIEKRHALTLPQQKLLEDFLKKQGQYNKWYPIFVIMLWTGMRVGEITGLRWCDIDLEKGTIDVNHTLVYYSKGKGKECKFAVNTPKTKAGCRVVPMTPKVKEAFELERELQKEFEISSTASIDGYSNFIFVNRFGSVQHQGTLNKALKRIIRDCNFEVFDKANGSDSYTTLPPFSCHNLRHTFCTRLCEANLNPKAIQEIMGHADIETTVTTSKGHTISFFLETA